ncbi:MAG: YHS domain-containing protein [Oceanospirillaceae bacterium]|jgi:YHS domain-containing protein
MQKILFGLLMLFSISAFAADKSYFENEKGAVNGYDVVAYFTQSAPVKGDKKFHYQWKNNNWYFSSAENLAKFQQSPEKYAPQYGGFCAFAAANDALAPTVPEAWTIVDGKLYLNYSLNVKKKWSKKIPEFISEANENWAGLSKKVANY